MSDAARADWVREAFAAASGGELDTLIGMVDPDIEWIGPQMLEIPSHSRGADAVRAWFAASDDVWHPAVWEPLDVRENGDRVLVELEFHATARQTGLEFRLRYFNVLTFRDGRVARLEMIRDRDEAFARAGLEAPPD